MTNQPWLPYIVTEYIKRLKPKTVFEWGSGGSTLFFTKELDARLVSVEHDANFYGKMIETLAREMILSAYHFIPPERGEIGPDKANPAHYKSGSTELGQVNFKKYVSIIDDFDVIRKYDLILIDGMARASCLYHAFNHVNPGGCIVLDNTGDRPYYLEQTAHLFGDWETGWERITMMGYGPILDYKWETTIFINKGKGKGDYESETAN